MEAEFDRFGAGYRAFRCQSPGGPQRGHQLLGAQIMSASITPTQEVTDLYTPKCEYPRGPIPHGASAPGSLGEEAPRRDPPGTRTACARGAGGVACSQASGPQRSGRRETSETEKQLTTRQLNVTVRWSDSTGESRWWPATPLGPNAVPYDAVVLAALCRGVPWL
jgi:hypothetical protein